MEMGVGERRRRLEGKYGRDNRATAWAQQTHTPHSYTWDRPCPIGGMRPKTNGGPASMVLRRRWGSAGPPGTLSRLAVEVGMVEAKVAPAGQRNLLDGPGIDKAAGLVSFQEIPLISPPGSMASCLSPGPPSNDGPAMRTDRRKVQRSPGKPRASRSSEHSLVGWFAATPAAARLVHLHQRLKTFCSVATLAALRPCAACLRP